MTSLPTAIVAGDPGHLGHHNTVHALLNPVDAPFSLAGIDVDALTSLPAAGVAGRQFFDETFKRLLTDDGAIWRESDAWTFNVKAPKYGATGNGVTDDTAAIQAAINDASGAYNYDPRFGGVVLLPVGIYRITASLNLDSNVALRGLGSGTIILIDFNGAGIKATSFDAGGMSGWCVQHLTLMTTSTTTTAVGIQTVAFGAGSGGHIHCLIEDVQIRKTSGSVPVYGTFLHGFIGDFFITSTVRDLVVSGTRTGGTGVWLKNASNASTFLFVHLQNGCAEALRIEGVSSPYFFGLTVEGCGTGTTPAVVIVDGAPTFVGAHFENNTAWTDVQIRGGAGGSFLSGECVSVQYGFTGTSGSFSASQVADWSFVGVLFRQGLYASASVLSGLASSCAAVEFVDLSLLITRIGNRIIGSVLPEPAIFGRSLAIFHTSGVPVLTKSLSVSDSSITVPTGGGE